MGFTSDLKFGEDGEHQMVKYLMHQGLSYQGTSKELYPDKQKQFDLVFNRKKQEILVEVKTDKYINDTRDTKNIVFEISCSGKPSGIETTEAHIWVNYFANKKTDNVWMIKVDVLKRLISSLKETGEIVIKSGGDNNKVRLCVLPRNDFKEYFMIDTWVSEIV